VDSRNATQLTNELGTPGMSSIPPLSDDAPEEEGCEGVEGTTEACDGDVDGESLGLH
jgi:hypothetical protein